MRQMNHSKVKPQDIAAVFITHLHGDHFYGLPGLGMGLLGSGKEPLLIAPCGLEGATSGPFGIRGFKLRSISRPKDFSKNIVDQIVYDNTARCYKVYEDKNYVVEANAIRHSIFCLGYVIREKVIRGKFNKDKMEKVGLRPGPIFRDLEEGKSVEINGRTVKPEDVMDLPRKARKIVILGDTCDPSAMVSIAGDADVVVHEATCSNEEKTVALMKMHSTAGMAGAFAKRINAKNLILTHFSPRNFNNNEFSETICVRELVEQARRTFGKSTVYPADDFWRFHVPLPVDVEESLTTLCAIEQQ